jgi:hypothetical protein
MIKIEVDPNWREPSTASDKALQAECRELIEVKIRIILENGLPANWTEMLTSPVLSDAGLKKAHDKDRENCCFFGLEDADPRKCFTPNKCQQCKNFDPYNYSIGPMLEEKGDILLYPSKKDEDTFLSLLEGLTTALAILAFIPCGVPYFWGYSYEAKFDV